MRERDRELMHLTAESTSKDSNSLSIQSASRLPDRKTKISEKDTNYRDLTESLQKGKMNKMDRSGDGHCHPVLSIYFDTTDGKHN